MPHPIPQPPQKQHLMDESCSNIVNAIKEFHKSLEAYLPALEQEVNRIIENKSTDTKEIEYLLDTLSPFMHGIGDSLYLKLIEYYKTIDAEAAKFYLEEYNKLLEEEEK